MVQRNQAAGRLLFHDRRSRSAAHGVIQFVAVGTPPDEDARRPAIRGRCGRAPSASTMNEYKVIVDKSTVRSARADRVRAAGAGRITKTRLLAHFSVGVQPGVLHQWKAARRWKTSCVPTVSWWEPTMPGDRTDARALRAVQRNHERLIVMDIKSVELTKYAANAMLATASRHRTSSPTLAEILVPISSHVRHGIGSGPRIGYIFSTPAAATAAPASPRTCRRCSAPRGQRRRVAGIEGSGRCQRRAKTYPAEKDCAEIRQRPVRQAHRALGSGVQANTDTCAKRPAAYLSPKACGKSGATVSAYDPAP